MFMFTRKRKISNYICNSKHDNENIKKSQIVFEWRLSYKGIDTLQYMNEINSCSICENLEIILRNCLLIVGSPRQNNCSLQVCSIWKGRLDGAIWLCQFKWCWWFLNPVCVWLILFETLVCVWLQRSSSAFFYLRHRYKLTTSPWNVK